MTQAYPLPLGHFAPQGLDLQLRIWIAELIERAARNRITLCDWRRT